MDTVYVVGVDSVIAITGAEPPWAMISAMGALVIAVLALVFSGWQGWETRRHNRKTVKPTISINRSIGGQIGWKLGIRLKNTGFGPGVVRKIALGIKDKKFNGCELESVYAALDEGDCKLPWINIGGMSPGETLQAGEEIWMLWAVPSDKRQLEEFCEKICRFTLDVDYESVYGDKDKTSVTSVEWEEIKKIASNNGDSMEGQ